MILQTLSQKFTVCKLSDMENIVLKSDVFFLAKTDEEITPNNDFIMGGNKISVRTLDLNLDFPQIAAQLDKIVKVHFEL